MRARQSRFAIAVVPATMAVMCLAAGSSAASIAAETGVTPGAGTAATVSPSLWSASVAASSVGPGLSSFGPTLAFGADGSGLVTWGYRLGTGHTGQRATQRRPDGSFGPEVELPWRSGPPSVFGANGAIALLTPEARRVRVVSGTTSGTFAGARTIHRGPPAAYQFARIAANDGGQVAVVQRSTQPNRDSRITLVERLPGGPFGRPRLIRDKHFCQPPRCPHYDSAGGELAVAVGARGDVVVVWDENSRLLGRVRRRGERMGPVVTLGHFSRIWGGVRVAVSPAGAVWVGWFDHPVAGGHGPLWIKVKTRPAGARRFARTRVLDHRASMNFTNFQTLRLALDPQGAAFAAWHGPGPKLAELDPTGAPVRTRQLARSGDVLSLATSGRPGEALVLWADTPEFMTGLTQVLGGVTSPGGAFTGAEAVTPVAPVASAAAAFSPLDGSPTVVWDELSFAGSQGPPGSRVSAIGATTRPPVGG